MPMLHKYRIQRRPLRDPSFSHTHASSFIHDEEECGEIITDNQGIILSLDNIAERWFGYKTAQIIDAPFTQLTASIHESPMATSSRELLEKRKSLRLTFRCADGTFFTGRVTLLKEEDHRDSFLKEEIKPASSQGIESLTEKYETLAQIGSWYMDAINNTIKWTPGVYSIFGLKAESPITPEHVLNFFHSYRHQVKMAFRQCLLTGKPFTLQVRLLNTAQKSVWVKLVGEAEFLNSKVVRLNGTIQDISPLRRIKQNLIQKEDCLTGILNSCQDPIVAIDNRFQVTAMNQAYHEAFLANFGIELNLGDALDEKLKGANNSSEYHRIYLRQWQRAFERDHFEVEMPLAQREEDLPVYKILFTRLTNRHGDTVGASHIARDISAQVNVQDQLNYLSRHDPLTGTLNRKAFYQRLTRALEHGTRRETSHALLFLNLDHFKTLNQRVGHNVGDILLRKISDIINNKIRDRDALARIGGNEFAVLLENCHIGKAQPVAEQICDAISHFSFEWQGQLLQVTTSIGLSAVSAGSGPVEQLLEIAGHGCYAAQSAGGNRVQLCQSTSLKKADHNELKISRKCIKQLQMVLQDDSTLELEYQTIRPVNGAAWGDHFEILTRIRYADNSRLSPHQFLPVAEQFNLICSFDRAVIHKVIYWLSAHKQQSHRQKLCAINLSLGSMLDHTLPNYIAMLLKKMELSAEKLCFELNENHIITHWDKALTCINTLRKMDCRMTIERVGSSKANFRYLADLDVDFVKIDGNLICQMKNDPVARILVESIHKIANMTDKQTIAGFVENQATLRDVRKLGLDFGQGFGIAQPKPINEIAA